MTDLAKVAEYYCDLFEKFSTEPIAIDRLDQQFRVGFSDLSARFPELTMQDRIELTPLVNRELKRRGIKIRSRRK